MNSTRYLKLLVTSAILMFVACTSQPSSQENKKGPLVIKILFPGNSETSDVTVLEYDKYFQTEIQGKSIYIPKDYINSRIKDQKESQEDAIKHFLEN